MDFLFQNQFTYFWVDFLCILFPFVFSLTKVFDFHKDWKYYFPANLIVAFIFIIWDIYKTHAGVWWFDTKYTLGIQIVNLPLEEVFFFICIPYACVFTYYCFKKYIKINAYFIRLIEKALWSPFILIGLYYYDRLYPMVTFSLLGISWLVLKKYKPAFFPAFLLVYLFMFFPFFLSNGVLTGGFINRSIVNYNPEEIIGYRLYTIPFEDYFYGMLLILWTIALYEYFKSIKKW
jgi:lycopene cyclase domain-containing protein